MHNLKGQCDSILKKKKYKKIPTWVKFKPVNPIQNLFQISNLSTKFKSSHINAYTEYLLVFYPTHESGGGDR
jgi:hypothetical protein